MIDRRSLLLATAALAACAGQPRLRIGYQNGLLAIAKARGTLDGIARVDWQPFASGPPLLEAMSVGRLDLGGTGDTPPIVAATQGAGIVLIAAQPVSGRAAAIIVPRNSATRDVAGLRGLRVAWLRGSSAEAFARRALAAAGLGLSDVEAINLAPDDAAAAFAGGSLDAWAVWDPYFAAAEIDQGGRIILAGEPLAASTSFLVASRDFAQTRSATLRSILDALKRTSAWAGANRGDLAALIAQVNGLSPAVAARVASRLDVGLVPIDDATIAAEQRVADRLFAEALIPARVDVAGLRWAGWRG